MNEEAFMNLVKDNNGFEFVIGFKDFVDHKIGGQDNKYWYYIDYNGKKAEYYVGTYENGVWTDKFYIEKGDKLESKISYSAWYCGHWHIDKRIDRLHFLMHSVEAL